MKDEPRAEPMSKPMKPHGDKPLEFARAIQVVSDELGHGLWQISAWRRDFLDITTFEWLR